MDWIRIKKGEGEEEDEWEVEGKGKGREKRIGEGEELEERRTGGGGGARREGVTRQSRQACRLACVVEPPGIFFNILGTINHTRELVTLRWGEVVGGEGRVWGR